MSATPAGPGPSQLRESQSTAESVAPHRPVERLTGISTGDSVATIQDSQGGPRKRRNHRAGKKKKSRRQSFLPVEEDDEPRSSHNIVGQPSPATSRPPFYQSAQGSGRNLSETSLASEALLDHRGQQSMRPRRDSRVAPNPYARQSNTDVSSPYRAGRQESYEGQRHRPHYKTAHASSGSDSGDDAPQVSDKTPLLGASQQQGISPTRGSGTGPFTSQSRNNRQQRRNSTTSSLSSKRRGLGSRQQSYHGLQPVHDVNNPPSVPNSPKLAPDMGYDDIMVANSFAPRSPEDRRDQIIDIDTDGDGRNGYGSSPSAPRRGSMDGRRHTIALPAEEDVCFPIEGMSVIGEEDYTPQDPQTGGQSESRRRRYRGWPDLSVLDEWSREEKEERSDEIRTKKISEPVLVGGRLRPHKRVWHRAEEDAPYRFTYFNEEIPSTIHSQTISELLQPGQQFRDLFIPDPPELSDDDYSSEEDDNVSHSGTATDRHGLSPNSQSRATTRHSSIIGGIKPTTSDQSGEATPAMSTGQDPKVKEKRYGDRPTFWLDVLSPTDTEMRVISKTFGIHPLTAEDIMMQEAREKVELFPKYYFVNYRTFEQDENNEDYLDPVNMYVVVFPEGVISFHFSMTPHPANVRRRIRQLKEYLQPSSDWISYALIDDITDVFAPLIQSIEEEVDDIDDVILRLHSEEKKGGPLDEKAQSSKSNDGRSDAGEGPSGGAMLQRVGEVRKKVMSLYRLLGNKADVIKGFAKRCNERWQIAPKSDIGLYLGDIQDHILTMTSNLSHYETLLSRAHSNYLAQINIRMNERQEQTADVLGKLTVLGTIVLPMNIITGMWGMNVLVPGQDVDNVYWFWGITAFLFIFGTSCFFIAKRVYGIV